MEQQLDRIEALLYRIQYQLTNIAILLNKNNNNNNNNNISSDQQLLDDLAERRRVALERQRLEWEQRGGHTPVSCCRRRSEDGEDEID